MWQEQSLDQFLGKCLDKSLSMLARLHRKALECFLTDSSVCLIVSHLYGFGLMDAEAMVKEAEQWKQVPAQHVCVESADRQIR